MSETQSNTLFTFEPSDVSITVTYNGEIYTGRVSSHAMALASPVWEKFLFPPWLGSGETKSLEGRDVQSPPVQQLDFAEDDGEALLILLRIVHLQFKEIPATLPYDLLLDLATLVDKYLCIGIIRPWLATWLANEETEWKAPGHECWLFIAWVFGRNEVFEKLALKMVKDTMVNADGAMITSSGEPISEPMPEGIIEHVLAVRQATIDKLLDIPYAHVESYESSNDVVCQRRSEQKVCDALVYGSLIRGLQIAGLWPRKKPEEIHVSINQLASTLESLEIFDLSDVGSYYANTNHISCSIRNFQGQVRTDLLGIPCPVLDSHYRHMDAQKASPPIEIAEIERTSLISFKHGNVQIKVTYRDELVMGEVSSHCMAMASKVWENLIFNPRAKHQAKDKKSQGETEDKLDPGSIDQTHNNQCVEKEGPASETDKQGNSGMPVKEVDFRAENGEALILLLRIAHLHYSDIPKTLAYKTLLDVAVLCDRYNCVELVQPWLPRWLSDEEKSCKEAEHENWLFIAWVFGRDKVFSDLTANMVREATTNKKGKYLKFSGAKVSWPMPPKILKRIREVREEAIKNLLEVPYGRLDQYESTTAGICYQPENREACDAAIYGSIARGLQKADLWPRKQARDVHISVEQLAAKVKNIPFHYINYNYENHYNCGGPNFKGQVASILSAIPSLVLTLHSRHMEVPEENAI